MKFFLVLAVFSQLAAAQDIPRLPDGKPDLNGVWERPYVADMSRNGANQQGAGPLPFTPWGEDNFKSYDVSKVRLHGPLPAPGLDALDEFSFPN